MPVHLSEVVFAYVSNENPTLVEVYFDDVVITHTKSNLLQSNEYYPFGMTTASSWTRENVQGNSFLANGGTELNTTSQLYDLEYRNFDPVLGRLHQVDPLADGQSSFTPYHFAYNNPVSFADVNGAKAKPWSTDFAESYIGDDYGTRNSWAKMVAHGGMDGYVGGAGEGWDGYVGHFDLYEAGFGFGNLYAQKSKMMMAINDALSGNKSTSINTTTWSSSSRGGYNVYTQVWNPWGGKEKKDGSYSGAWTDGSESLINAILRGGYGLWFGMDDLTSAGPEPTDPLKDAHGHPVYTLEQFLEANKGKSFDEIINQRKVRNGMAGGPEMRMVQNPRDGNIMDMRHVMVVGYQYGRFGGYVFEITQWVRGIAQAFNGQDLYSNAIGDDFHSYLFSKVQDELGRPLTNWKPADWSQGFYDWMNRPK